MKLDFSKMHGAGNDFIVVADNPSNPWNPAPDTVRKICDRQRGVGGDGLIVVRRFHRGKKCGFRMVFFNCDGSEAQMCGNGLRCAAMFCGKKFKTVRHITFFTGAGELEARILGGRKVMVKIPVSGNFKKIRLYGKDVYCGNTGVPHAVLVVKNVSEIDVVSVGRKIRFHKKFAPAGTNVNFVSLPVRGSRFCEIRTYERGVEGETSACGTGISASAICLNRFFGIEAPVKFITKDKDALTVEFGGRQNILNDCCEVELSGPAVEVFKGILNLEKF